MSQANTVNELEAAAQAVLDAPTPPTAEMRDAAYAALDPGRPAREARNKLQSAHNAMLLVCMGAR